MPVTLTEIFNFFFHVGARLIPFLCVLAPDRQTDVFGRFHLPSSGKLAAIKLVHLYGYVSCFATRPEYWSYWGCAHNPLTKNQINVVVTNAHNHNILPPNQLLVRGGLAAGKWDNDVGYSSLSSELVLSLFSHPLHVCPRARSSYNEG